MKKTILSVLALGLMTTAGITSQAAPATEQTTVTAAQADEKKTEVGFDTLPAAIRELLSTDTYKDWTPGKAWLVSSDSGEYFLVEIHKGDEKQSLKFDTEGKLVG